MSLAIVHVTFADILHQMGRFNEAISHCQSSIDIQLQLPTRTNIRLARAYKNIGMTYGSKGELCEALHYFSLAYDLASENLILTSEIHQVMADIYVNLKQFNKALEHLNQAKTIQDQVVPNKQINVATRLHTTGMLHYEKANFDCAFKNLTDAMAIYRKELSELHPTVCDIYLKLGLTLEKLNKIDEALEAFKKAKEINLVIYPQYHALIASGYHRISIILRDKNLLEESLDNAKQALDLAMIAQPINYHELARIHDTLASIYIKQRDFTQARIEVQNSSNVRQSHCPGDLSLSHISLANICINENSIQEAIDILNLITDDQLLSVHNYTPTRLGRDIAVIYDSLNQYESALRMIDFALNHVSDDEHYLGATTHFLAGQIYWKLNNKSQTLDHLDQALIMLDDKTNEQHCEMISRIYKNLAKIHESLNEYHQARNCYQEILRFCKTEEFAQIHMNIGICYAEFNEMELSLESYQLAQTLCSPTDYELLADIHYELGKYYVHSGKNIEALEHFETTLHNRLLYMKSDDPRLYFLHEDLSNLYLECGKYEKAIELYERLVERQLEQDDHENAVNSLTLLGITRARQKNMDKSIHYFQLEK
jgi:tetratricopeptide (TPR) repeat protein